MAAPLWSSSLALMPAARICRCSQASMALHALRAGRFSSAPYRTIRTNAVAQPENARSPVRVSIEEDAEPLELEKVDKEEAPRSPNADMPTFDSMEGVLSPPILRALTRGPFRLTNMSPVQAAVVPLLPRLTAPYEPNTEPEGPRDLLVKARTGTGKTLAFLIPAVEARLKRLAQVSEQVVRDVPTANKTTVARAVEKFARSNIGALIISPTRELATQIANEAIRLTKHTDRFEVRLLVGGLPKRPQLREWHTGRRDIVVATPGRLRDFIENEPNFPDELKTAETFILDEADTLLDMGFREDIQAITENMKPPPERQTFMFSATVSTAIRQVARKTLAEKHEFINCVPNDAPPTHHSIPQYYTAVPSASEQLAHIIRLIIEDQLLHPEGSKVLVFLPTTSLTALYYTILNEVAARLFPAGRRTGMGELHSKKNMGRRIRVSDWFRTTKSSAAVLVTSDVSARGVDYPGVTRVIQVGIPPSGDSYVHRVGRTGRGSNMSGRADLVLMPWEIGFLTWQLTDIPLKELPTNQLKQQVAELAAKHDENPKAFGRTLVGPKLEQVDEAIADVQKLMSPDDVRDAMVSVLAYYVANHEQLRIKKGVTAAGVHEWAAALLGEKTDLRLPRDLVEGKVRTRAKTQSYARDSRDSGRFGSDRGGWGRESSGFNSFRSRDRDDFRSGNNNRSFGRRNNEDDDIFGEDAGERRSFRPRDSDNRDNRSFGGFRGDRDNRSFGGFKGDRDDRSFSRRRGDDDDAGDDAGERRSFRPRDNDRPARRSSTPSWMGRGSQHARKRRDEDS
ncbi:DEAD-domain-containing protein [Pilatotrama ljubarskyi]|nr:DEAD-domain-containing protein [Pilatotrama ljubarskyi]